MRGCACRGTAGFAHVSCLADMMRRIGASAGYVLAVSFETSSSRCLFCPAPDSPLMRFQTPQQTSHRRVAGQVPSFGTRGTGTSRRTGEQTLIPQAYDNLVELSDGTYERRTGSSATAG